MDRSISGAAGLSASSRRRLPGLTLPRLLEADACTRPAYERFIAARFAEAYGASLYSFMPRLFGLHESDGRLVAAFGLRAAVDAPLFLERYLDAPAEQVLSRRLGRPVARDEIIEVGNLAGATTGALRHLIPVLAEWLDRAGYRWLVFTGSPRLGNGFAQAGVALDTLGLADPKRLPAREREAWGRYYEAQPSVLLGDIRSGQRDLMERAARRRAALAGTSAVPTAMGVS